MWLSWLLFMVLISAAIKHRLQANTGSRSADDALTILKKRDARGEMDDEEFERRRKMRER